MVSETDFVNQRRKFLKTMVASSVIYSLSGCSLFDSAGDIPDIDADHKILGCSLVFTGVLLIMALLFNFLFYSYLTLFIVRINPLVFLFLIQNCAS